MTQFVLTISCLNFNRVCQVYMLYEEWCNLYSPSNLWCKWNEDYYIGFHMPNGQKWVRKPLGKRLPGRPRKIWKNSEIDFRATCGENENGCLQSITLSLFVKKTAPAGWVRQYLFQYQNLDMHLIHHFCICV